MTISTELVKELRDKTGAGVLACREALEETEGDVEKAVRLLRERGIAAAEKRADRETRNGVLDLYNHGDGRVGVMVEVNCETDFVARTEDFHNFAHEIALQIAANTPRWVQADDVPDEVLEEERAEARIWAENEGKPENVIGRIIDGRIEKFLDENCLLRQSYIRDDTKTVEGLLKEMIASTGENITIRRFERWTVGEDLE
ncbi:MAG: translation elongation factor Ts [Anaerolineales bacterium]|nr:translation elongation factor Ts [Anaerolineales bacterium]